MTGGLAELADTLGGTGPTFAIDGRQFTVPARPLADWLRALDDPSPESLVPGLLDVDDQAHLYDRLLDEYDPLDHDVLERAGQWLLEETTGRSWWEVRRLVATAAAAWNAFDGWCIEQQLDPAGLTLRRLCTAVVRFMINALPTAAAREEWLSGLQLPPTPDALADRPEWSAEAEGESFAAFMAAHGGGD